MTAALLQRPATPRGVEAVPRPSIGGYRYRTRFTHPVTGGRVPVEFDTIEEVLGFRELYRRAKSRGELGDLLRGDLRLAEFVTRYYLPRHVDRKLAKNTRGPYLSVYRNHLEPHIGRIRIRHVSAAIVSDLIELLLAAGVGTPTVRRAVIILQGICSLAVQLGQLDGNPVREVAKPSVTRKLAIVAPGPWQIEALRAQLDPLGGALVSIIGYLGLRPSEALALEERHLMRTTMLVEQRLVDGDVVVGQKQARGERSSRSPRLYDVVRGDIDRHLGDVGRRGRRRLLFPGAHGAPWTTADYRRWREQIFAPAVTRAGIDLGRVYDLRHGCASLQLHAGRPLREIADDMGHSVATLSAYYAHIIADLRGVDPKPVEQQIADARKALDDAS